MDIKEIIKTNKIEIDNLLKEYFESYKIQELQNAADPVLEMFENVSEYTQRSGAKRIRPIIMTYAYKLYSDQNLEEIKKISIICEFVQSFALIHDDIMDNSATRRAKPTLHRLYAENMQNQKTQSQARDFGVNAAILCGDLASAMIYKIIADSPLDNTQKSELTRTVSNLIIGTINGQLLDLYAAAHDGFDFAKEKLLEIALEKTGHYTFSIPVLSGASLANADPSDIEILTEYAQNAGAAFQIRDDIIGIFGNDKETGKSNLDDIKEGKRTILSCTGYQKATALQKAILEKTLGNQNATEADASQIREIFESTGALKEAEDTCQMLVEKSYRAFEKLKPKTNPEAWQVLYEIADLMIRRNA